MTNPNMRVSAFRLIDLAEGGCERVFGAIETADISNS